MKKRLLTIAALSLLAATSASAAITYHGAFTTTNPFVGTSVATASYSITTNGTIGALSIGDFISADITLTAGYVFNFVTTPSFYFGGASATATQLFFDYSPGSGLSFSTTLGSHYDMCFNGPGFNCFGEPMPSSSIKFGIFDFGSESFSYLPQVTGPTVIATTVPEPGSWAMMIAGFGLVGAMRRRHRRLALRLC